MDQLKICPAVRLSGRVRVPGDKSISHRAVLLGALGEGTSHFRGFLKGGDTLASVACVRALGIEVQQEGEAGLSVHGRGLAGLRAPAGPLDCVRSATTMRLLAGILAGQPFESVLTGDPQLLGRPMRRIADPLRQMGAQVEDTAGRAPLTIRGSRLRGGVHTLAVASAQVKSALLLAGLYADGPTTVRQPGPARDHTERMLSSMGVEVVTDDLQVTLKPALSLSPLSVNIPGDISSAAFLVVAAALLPGSAVTMEEVGINPTRTGLLDVLRAMGVEMAVENEHLEGNEPVADLTVREGELVGVEVAGDTVVRMIDEFPVFAVAATQARGTSVVRDAAELRAKETDRIAAMVAELRALGARIDPLDDGFVVEGPTPLRGGVVDSHGDHRLALALAVAGLVAKEEVVVKNAGCIADSFPGFVELTRKLVCYDGWAHTTGRADRLAGGA